MYFLRGRPSGSPTGIGFVLVGLLKEDLFLENASLIKDALEAA